MIRFTCPDCERQLRVKPDLAGRKAKCPHCGAVMMVPPEEIPFVEAVPSPRRQPTVFEDERDDEPEPRRRRRVGFRCPYCNTSALPTTRSQISTAGWVTFVLLLVLLCWPLCWIGLLIK